MIWGHLWISGHRYLPRPRRMYKCKCIKYLPSPAMGFIARSEGSLELLRMRRPVNIFLPARLGQGSATGGRGLDSIMCTVTVWTGLTATARLSTCRSKPKMVTVRNVIQSDDAQ